MDTVDGFSKIHLNYGKVGWEVHEVNLTSADSCLSPSREAGTFGGKTSQTTTHSNWAHSYAPLGEGRQFGPEEERPNGLGGSAFQNESCKAH